MCLAGPHAQVRAEESEVKESTSDFAKVEETLGGAIPDALSTDSEVVKRWVID